MMMQEQNQVQQLCFSGSHINAKYLKNVTDYYIKNSTIVINPDTSDAYVDEPPRNIIPPLSSTILKDIYIKKASSLILLEVTETKNIGNIILESGWKLLGDIIDTPSNPIPDELPYPKNTPLWRSLQDSIGTIELDPYVMTRQKTTPDDKKRFEIKVNLWFAPSNTHCFIHNQHDFIEIHSQVLGNGRMQKFKAQNYDTLYEDMMMSPGYTTSVPFCKVEEEQSKYVYPWHQYYADTDCIWLAIEYHPF
jgi:hypothetical protein